MPLLDLILGYDCNLACDYCTITPEMRSRALSTAAVVTALKTARADGFDAVSFTGGEPTIRRDLIGLVKAARAAGFADVKLQSNGLLYAQGANVDRLAAAGVTRWHLSIHTHLEDAYDALVQRAGSWPLMVAGLDALIARGVTLVVDVIIKAETARRLPDAIAWLAARGVRAVDLWFVSLTDGNRDNVRSMPRMTDALPHVHAALAAARVAGVAARSLHIPRCLLGDDVGHAWDPGAGRVRVVSPDATFDLRDSRLAGQVHVPACEGCLHRAICPGVRPDYLERFGDAEIAAARGQASAVAPTRRLPVAV